jgi:hypothetical protein
MSFVSGVERGIVKIKLVHEYLSKITFKENKKLKRYGNLKVGVLQYIFFKLFFFFFFFFFFLENGNFCGLFLLHVQLPLKFKEMF